MRKKQFTIFFSWQTDINGNKKIIKDSILAECQKQKEKNGYNVTLDEATRNLPGSPKIEDAVLDKISKADVFVCDITPVAVCGQKQMPNSNVLFELGYAFHVLGEERIIMLAKKGKWNVSDLPFDFNHRRIGPFTSAKDCNLEYEINSCLEYCAKHHSEKTEGYKRHHLVKSLLAKLASIRLVPKHKNEIFPIKATEESTVFFARRMAAAFPGVRGVVEFTDRKEIIKRLSVLLQYPLKFEHGLDGTSSDPVWYFRAGSAEDIQSFCQLGRKKVLMNTDELLIRRIVVYRDSGRYYGEYVYVEVDADKSSGCSSYNDVVIKDFVETSGYYNEEFAVFKPSWYMPERKISRQEYDDGTTMVNGRLTYLHGRAKLRCRYLTPYNFILSAKFSPFNCLDFDRTSGEVFKGMLDGTISNEEFNKYMSVFPKRDAYR